MTRITVRVTPRASRNGVLGWDGEVLQVRVTAPPADGRANEAVIALLSKAAGVPRSKIRLVSGASARKKIFDIHSLSLADIHAAVKPG